MHIRKSARAIIVNEYGEILLQRFIFKNVLNDKGLWVTPGGGIKAGETVIKALERELFEELHIKVSLHANAYAFSKDVLIHGKSGDFISREMYYKVPLRKEVSISCEHMTKNEQDTLQAIKWWKKENFKKRNDFRPKELLNFI